MRNIILAPPSNRMSLTGNQYSVDSDRMHSNAPPSALHHGVYINRFMKMRKCFHCTSIYTDNSAHYISVCGTKVVQGGNPVIESSSNR